MAGCRPKEPVVGGLRGLPSVDEVLRSEECVRLLAAYSPALVTDLARRAVSEARGRLLEGGPSVPPGSIVRAVVEKVDALMRPSMVRVVNATGTMLHTNLGRAVLPPEAVEAVLSAASGPVNLEFDLPSREQVGAEGRARRGIRGGRGERDGHVSRLLCALSGAEGACVVNNNAAAVLITLNALAKGREVVISRGELIEIGGSFRLPDIIRKSGCILKEVGTTNRTHPRDYADAITPKTALILKAHTSNYVVTGFTAQVGLKELVEIGREKGVPVVEDLGSGALIDLARYGLPAEPVVGERVALGADAVTFSGDKLLGGPQAGLIAGKGAVVERIRKSPLKRALRADKLTLAALEAVLRLHALHPDELKKRLPMLRAMTRPVEELEAAAQEAARLIRDRLPEGFDVTVVEDVSVVGGGSMPGRGLPTRAVAVTHSTVGPDRVARLFLDNTPPIIGRISRERFLLDMRTVEDALSVAPTVKGK